MHNVETTSSKLFAAELRFTANNVRVHCLLCVLIPVLEGTFLAQVIPCASNPWYKKERAEK